MVRNLNTHSKARLEDAERSRRYRMVCANGIGPSVDARRERLHEQSRQRQAQYRERCHDARTLPSFSLPALSAIVLPTDHVFVFLLSYPVRDCTPYHPCTLISLIMLHLSFHFHCPCTSGKCKSTYLVLMCLETFFKSLLRQKVVRHFK